MKNFVLMYEERIHLDFKHMNLNNYVGRTQKRFQSMENEAHINYLGEGQWNVPLPDKNSRILPVWTLSRPLTNNLLISSETTEKNLWMITDKNMQKLLKIVFGMNHRIIFFESTEKKISLSAD